MFTKISQKAQTNLQNTEAQVQVRMHPQNTLATMQRQAIAQMQEEEEEMMMKQNPAQKSESTASKTHSETQKQIPFALQNTAEEVLDTDLSAVKAYESTEASDMHALAFAKDNEIVFAPGQFDSQSQNGQALIGHELAHIKQQKEGKVKANTQMKGVPVNDEPALENEADRMGEKIAKA